MDRPGAWPAVAEAYGAALENVSIRASDGAILKRWLFTPHDYRDRAVLLVHAGMGNRRDMLGHAKWLLARGYACLLVDQRGCGTSSGDVTWGVKEPADISEWAAWLRDRTHASAIFGCGTSRGSDTPMRIRFARGVIRHWTPSPSS